MTNNTDSGPDFHFPSSPSLQIHPAFVSSTSSPPYHHQNARKKRTKMIKLDPNPSTSSTAAVSKPKYAKRPDPAAPKITRPCTECGKKFWSWKALFGHMRCHPERAWRGINPPPHFRRPASPVKGLRVQDNDDEIVMTEEDHEVAACLLLLANGDAAQCGTSCQVQDTVDGSVASTGGMNCRFECSSCKKVFGSHQALGGHRASHKNVKGCFAITRSDGEVAEDHSGEVAAGSSDVKENVEDSNKVVMVLGHKCSICLRVFSSGQALGGHKRCHWDKGEETSLNQGLNVFAEKESCGGLDLNLPAPFEDESCNSYSSGLTLDLRLGL